MNPPIDLTGQVFGRLTVLERVIRPAQSTGTWWLCRCSCGAAAVVRSNRLRSKKQPTRSCGCIQREQSAEFCRTSRSLAVARKRKRKS